MDDGAAEKENSEAISRTEKSLSTGNKECIPILSNALLTFLLFWIWSLSCNNNLFLGLILCLNTFRKSFLSIFAKFSPFSFPKYWVHITKALYHIPTRKLADLLPAPSFFRFPVQFNSSLSSPYALLLQWQAYWRLNLWLKFTPSK